MASAEREPIMGFGAEPPAGSRAESLVTRSGDEALPEAESLLDFLCPKEVDHLRRHESVKPYICCESPKLFYTASDLKTH